MKKTPMLLIVLGMIGILLLTSCIWDQPDVNEPFYLKYHKYGGFAGMSDKIEIFENHDVICRNEHYSYKTQIDEENLLDIYQTIMKNNFLGLSPDHTTAVWDDYYFSITYASNADTLTVTTNGHAMQHAIGSWKRRFTNVVEAIMNYRATLDMDIDSGYVTVVRNNPMVRWPYSNQFVLSDLCDSTITVSSEVYDYVRHHVSKIEHYQYFENDTIYSISTPSNNTIRVYSPTSVISWPFEPSLEKIESVGLGIFEDDYRWLKETLNNGYRNIYFYDFNTGNDARAYRLWLRQGNLFEKGVK